MSLVHSMTSIVTFNSKKHFLIRDQLEHRVFDRYRNIISRIYHRTNCLSILLF